MTYEYDLFLRCLDKEDLHLDGLDGGNAAQALRERAGQLHARLLEIADVVDKLAAAGWIVADSGEDPFFMCWRDQDPFTSEAALREHLQVLSIPVDANFLEISAVKDGSEDQEPKALVGAVEDDDEDDDDEEMPERRLYLVRWQNLSAALVMAHDELDLLNILDEDSDTTGCSWWEYDGPLFLDFDLPVDWKHRNEDEEGFAISKPEDWVPENILITKIPDDPNGVRNFEFSLAGSDTAFATEEKILELAFPRLHEVFLNYDGDDDGPSSEKVAEAVRDEIARDQRSSARRREIAMPPWH